MYGSNDWLAHRGDYTGMDLEHAVTGPTLSVTQSQDLVGGEGPFLDNSRPPDFGRSYNLVRTLVPAHGTYDMLIELLVDPGCLCDNVRLVSNEP